MKLTRSIEGAMVLMSVLGLGCFGQNADDGADDQNAPGPDAPATEFRKGTLVHSEQLSPTAKLEIWDHGEDGAAIALRGRSDFDAALKTRLPAAVKETGDLETVYRRLKPNATALPVAVRDFAQALARRPAPALGVEAAHVQAPPGGDPDTVGGETEANSIFEFDTSVNPNSLNAESTIWFRDTFCMVPGNEHGVCWLDRIPDPYIQKTAVGYRHIGTTETEVGTIRFRAWGTDCDPFCHLDLKYDVKSYPGEYHYYSWLNSDLHKERRFRVDASPTSNKLNTRAHLAMSWSGTRGGTSTPPVCIGVNGACTVDGSCCLGNRCVKAYNNTFTCQPNPTGSTSDCNWEGEACCVPSSVAADPYCNATYDPTLACSVGRCESGRR